jgi:dUTP pyrophosphatase
MKIQIKKLRPDAILPTRGSSSAAGYDLYACIDEDVSIPSRSTAKIGTGLSVAIPEGYFGAVFARSGLATKQGLRPANCVGVCDADYRGEYIVALHNDSEEPRVIHNGDRIAQLVILPFLSAEFEETDSLSDTDRGAGGFGSTGT